MRTVYISFPIGNPELAPIKRLLNKIVRVNTNDNIVVLSEKEPVHPIKTIRYETTLKKNRTRYIHIYQKIIGDYLEQISFAKKYLKTHLKDGDIVIHINISGLAAFPKTKAKIKNIAFQLELPFTLNPLNPENAGRQTSFFYTLFYKPLNGYLRQKEKVLSKMDWLILSNPERAEITQKHFKKDCMIIDNLSCGTNSNPSDNATVKDRKKLIYNGSISPLRNCEKMIELGKNKSNYTIDCFGPFRNDKIREAFLSKLKNTHVYYGGLKSHSEMMAILGEGNFGWGILFYSKNEENHRLCAPLKLYEFLCFGMPVVCTTNPPLKRIVEHYDCGILWHEGESPQDLIRKLAAADYTALAKNASTAYLELKRISEERLESVVSRLFLSKD